MQRTIGWKLAELDRILNDPTAPMEPHRVWSLLDDVSASFGGDSHDPCSGTGRRSGGSVFVSPF
jgi:hypothetical protein